ncbi:MAG: S41 family peptidase [Candidatus Thorarchaeota archaeon]
MHLSKKSLAIIVSTSLIIVITIPSTIFIIFQLNKTNASNHPSNMGVIEWLEDFNSFFEFIEDNYPYIWLKNRTHGYDWRDLKTYYEDRINNANSNEVFLSILFDAVQSLQNRHTQIEYPGIMTQYHSDFENWYPLNEVFSDKVVEFSSYWEPIFISCYQDRYRKSYDSLIVYEKGDYIIFNNTILEHLYGTGLKITKVNGLLIDEAVKECYNKDYLDWDFQRDKLYLWMISPRDFGENAVFTIRNSTGYETNITFNTLSEYSLHPYSYPEDMITTQTYESMNASYIHIKNFVNEYLNPYTDDIINFYHQIEDYDYLIIDIRGNPGGNYAAWMNTIVKPLLKNQQIFELYLAYRTDDYSNTFRESMGITSQVSKGSFSYLPPEAYTDEFKIYNYQQTITPTYEVNFNGEIIVLTDNFVYSAAEGFNLFCKQTGFATIYGTTSGGDGIMEFPTYYALPNSKLIICISSALGLDHTGHASEEVRTQPDFYYESTFGNFTELIDYVLWNLP